MASRPRVLVLTPDFPPEHGGIQTLVHRVVTGFETLDARVVAINDAGAGAFDRTSGIDTVRVGSPRLVNRANVALLNLRAVAEAARFRPDVVLCAHMVCAPAAGVIRRTQDVPYALYVYADELSAAPGMAGFAMRQARRVITISRHTEQLAVSAGGDPRRMELILPGVDLPPAVQREPAERPTFVTIASAVKRYKGHDVTIRALPLIRARVPDVEWVVIGSGPLEPLYRDMVRDARLQDHVRFCGFVDASERDGWLHRAHVFAMPSRLRPDGGGGEGFGIVFLEAGAHGVPVVAGGVAGALDAVVDGETGVLVDPTDHVQVADAVADLLLAPDRARRMGEAGRRWAEQHAWPAVAGRVERLLLGMSGPGNGPARHG